MKRFLFSTRVVRATALLGLLALPATATKGGGYTPPPTPPPVYRPPAPVYRPTPPPYRTPFPVYRPSTPAPRLTPRPPPSATPFRQPTARPNVTPRPTVRPTPSSAVSRQKQLAAQTTARRTTDYWKQRAVVSFNAARQKTLMIARAVVLKKDAQTRIDARIAKERQRRQQIWARMSLEEKQRFLARREGRVRLAALYAGRQTAAGPRVNFVLKPMEKDFVGWDRRPDGLRKPVKYFNDKELEARRLHIIDGKLYDANGNLFDTGKGRAIFVMDEKGDFYATTEDRRGHVHHSSLSNGKPVAGAGTMRVIQGRLERLDDIDNNSGHYKVNDPVIRTQATDQLLLSGVFVDRDEG